MTFFSKKYDSLMTMQKIFILQFHLEQFMQDIAEFWVFKTYFVWYNVISISKKYFTLLYGDLFLIACICWLILRLHHCSQIRKRFMPDIRLPLCKKNHQFPLLQTHFQRQSSKIFNLLINYCIFCYKMYFLHAKISFF